MSYSAPSGLTANTIQISRVLTRLVIRGVGAVALGQPAQDRERLLEREVLAGVVDAVEHDLGLGLVGGDVVGELGDPDGAALVALPDRAELDDVGVRGLGGLDLGDHLGVGVVLGVGGGEVRGRGGRGGNQRGRGREGECQGEGQGGRRARPRDAVVHADIIAQVPA